MDFKDLEEMSYFMEGSSALFLTWWMRFEKVGPTREMVTERAKSIVDAA